MMILAFWNPGDWWLIWSLNVLLQITIVATVSLLIGAGLRRHPAIRYGVLCSGLMLVLLAPVLAGVMQWSGRGFLSVELIPATIANRPLADVSTRSATRSIEFPSARPVNININPPLAAADQQLQKSLKPQSPRQSSPTADNLHQESTLATAISEQSSHRGNASDSSVRTTTGRWIQRVIPPLLAVWILGALLLLVRLVIGWSRLAVILHQARPNTDTALGTAFASATRSLLTRPK
ncbi:MAG: hypothetical protein V4719_09885, partial [Planctomycetota bacterium]